MVTMNMKKTVDSKEIFLIKTTAFIWDNKKVLWMESGVQQCECS